MNYISAAEFKLLELHARQLERNDTLELDAEQARLAIATLWDFRSWDQMAQAVRPDTEHSMVEPSALMRKPGGTPHPETTAIILRQAGRIINQMQLFPKLSEKVGEAVPQLYGFESMNALSKAGPLSLETTQSYQVSTQQAVNDDHALAPVAVRAFTGAGRPGITMVAGSDQDNPLAFTLNEAFKQSSGTPIRIFVSDEKAHGFRLTLNNDRVTLETAPTLSKLGHIVWRYLQEHSQALAIVSLEGFTDLSKTRWIFDELANQLKHRPSAHLMVAVAPLRTIPLELWDLAQYQVLLSQSLQGYSTRRNPLNLSDIEISQLVGFGSNRPRDFTYLVLENARNGQLIFNGVEKVRPGSSAKSSQCSA